MQPHKLDDMERTASIDMIMPNFAEQRTDKQPDWNIGYTTRDHLCIDLDNTTLYKVRCLTEILQEQYPQVGDALITLSSQNSARAKVFGWNPCNKRFIHQKDNYHVIFNNHISYETSCHIIEVLAELGVLNEQYVNIRSMRNDMTLRVSKTSNMAGVKPPPRWIDFIPSKHKTKDGDGIKRYMTLYKSVNLHIG